MQEARGSSPLSSTGKRTKSIFSSGLSAGLVATVSMRYAGEQDEDGRRLGGAQRARRGPRETIACRLVAGGVGETAVALGLGDWLGIALAGGQAAGGTGIGAGSRQVKCGPVLSRPYGPRAGRCCGMLAGRAWLQEGVASCGCRSSLWVGPGCLPPWCCRLRGWRPAVHTRRLRPRPGLGRRLRRARSARVSCRLWLLFRPAPPGRLVSPQAESR
jgi:hypothetical protein